MAEFVSLSRAALLLAELFSRRPEQPGSALRVCLGAHKEQQDGRSGRRGSVLRPLGPAADCGFAALQRRESAAVHPFKSAKPSLLVQLSGDARATGRSTDERRNAGSAAANSLYRSIQHGNRAASHREEHVQRNVCWVARD